jgi:DNA-binding NarL/FixJ family response regulator
MLVYFVSAPAFRKVFCEPKMTSILIADDHAVVRTGVRRSVEGHLNWSVVAEAADGREAIAKCIASKPDVAIVDFSLPLVDGLEVTREIRLHVPSTEVLIFTMHDNEGLLRSLVEAGARGYVLKSSAGEHLISAVRSVAAHRPYFSNASEGFLMDAPRFDQPLTKRERDVVHLVAIGHSNKQIANLLNISIKTIESHRASVMRKLGLGTMAALVRYAVRNKLTEA